MPTRLPTACIVVVFMLANAAAARAQADAIEQARRDLRDAEVRAARARDDFDAARSRLYAIRDRLELIRAELDRLPLETESMRQRLPEVEQASGAAESAAAEAQAASALARQMVDAITARVASIKQATEQRRRDVADALAASPEAVSADQRVNDAKSAVDAAVEAVKQRLGADPNYTRLQALAEQLRAEVQQLRETPGPPAALAERSQAWMTAQSEAGGYLGKAIDADESMRAAKASLSDAIVARRALDRQHADSVEIDPQVVQLRRRLETESAALASAEAEARRAESKASSSVGEATRLRAEIARIKDNLASVDARLEQLRRDYSATFEQHRLYELDLVRARQRSDAAERARLAAAERLRQLLERNG